MKHSYILLVLLLCILSVSSNVSAFFPKDHIAYTVNGFNTVNSPITQRCAPYLDLVLDGNNGADSGILHYGSSLVTSYIYTHVKAGYEQGLIEAGSNDKKYCLIIGEGLHITQDGVSHLPGGLVETYLKKFASTNYAGHMTVENDFTNKHIAQLTASNDYAITSGKLNYYNSIYLDNLIDIDGQATEYLKMFNKIANLDLTTDVLRIRANYQGADFYSATAKSRYTGGIPWWADAVIVGLLLVSLTFIVLIIWRGHSYWKWINVAWWGIVFIVGIVLLVSLLTLTFWSLLTHIMSITSSLGYLSVSQADVQHFSSVAQQATNDFLTTGQLKTLDSTGLSYCAVQNPATGVCTTQVSGALSNAEKPSKWIFYGLLMPLYLAISIYLSYKSFRRRKK